MEKVLKCGDLNPGCSYEARGHDENEVMEKAAQHAKSDHGIAHISHDMMKKVRSAIHDEPSKSVA
jgi:predicted small metal-binding protein